MNKRYTLVLLFVFSVQQSRSDIFSSTAHLQKSKNAAFGLRNDLREYIAGEELRLSRIKSHWNSLHTTENGWMEKLVDTVYKLRLEISGKESTLKFSRLYVHAAALPKPDDIQGIIVSMPGLQNVYNLTASQIAMGEYQGYNFGSLSAPACFDIGIYLAIAQYYRLSIEWVNTALNMAMYCMGDTAKGECINEQLINDIQVTLPKIEDDFGKLKSKTFQSIDEMIKKGTPVNSFITAEDWKILRDSKRVKYFGPEYLRNFPITHNFERLCSKQDSRKGGFCTVRRNTRMGYYEIPRKVELINKSPLIIMLHDVVDDRYINLLTKSSNWLSRSSIIASTATKESNLRTSKTYWLDDYEISVTKHINGILEEQTGFRLNRGSTENLQVVNYGIGGQYQPHYDFLPNTPAGSQRLATMLIYLSDVELGGSTVFPSLDIAVAPVKGSVLIFVNLEEHGDGIESTLHGGCPVFLGSKWIANKWVQLNGQDVNFRAIKPSAWTDVLSS